MSVDLFGGVTTADSGRRSEFDFYETPAWATASLIHFAPEIRGAVVMEPCSGRDAIARELRKVHCRVHTNDIDATHPAETHHDATQASYWQSLRVPGTSDRCFDWIVTNPPFNIAFQMLVLAYEHAKDGVAFLLRKSFMEPTEARGPWLSAHPPNRIIGLPRHAFRGGATDSVSSDWFIWDKHDPARPFVIDAVAKSRRTLRMTLDRA